ncbi:MAG TPA: MaoC/PaaZ C-terminal domain-containing protein [Candidatus Dormibacteraeota bacterium]|nr:MaoC/PaaZ C-terminal domain-containing protein [Candidatus Dormibacteraeota bacterium]
MKDLSRLDRFPPQVGNQLPERRRTVTQQVISAYAEASGDHNPIHLDLEYARQAGLPATIAHGLLTLGTACAGIEGWAEEAAWTSRVSCRFSAPVPAGAELSCRGLVTAAGEDSATIDLTVLTSTGERALTKARVELRAL